MRYEVLGVNDERTTCECCGREGLKRVVWIRDNETGSVKHFGTSCATAPAKGFGIDREIKSAIGKAKRKMEQVYQYAYFLYRNAGGQINASGEILDQQLMDVKRKAAKAAL